MAIGGKCRRRTQITEKALYTYSKKKPSPYPLSLTFFDAEQGSINGTRR